MVLKHYFLAVMTLDKARDKVAEMMLNKRYLQDVWT